MGAVRQQHPVLQGGDHTAVAQQHQKARLSFRSDFAFTKAATIAADGNLELVGYASTWVLDRDGEYIDPRAYDGTLQAYLDTNPMLLWQHNQDWPLGQVVEATVDANGLLVRAVVRKPEPGEEPWKLSAYNDIKSGIIRTFSVGGFFTRDFVGGRIVVTEIELLEISVVSIPSNPASIFEAAQKALGHGSARPVLPQQAVAQMEQLLGLRDITDPELVVMYTRGTAAEQAAEVEARYLLLCDLYTKAGKLPPGRQVWQEAKREADPLKRLARVTDVMRQVQGHVDVKAGRVLSKANETTLGAATDEIMAGVERIRTVLAQVAQDTPAADDAPAEALGVHDYRGNGGACVLCGEPPNSPAHGGGGKAAKAPAPPPDDGDPPGPNEQPEDQYSERQLGMQAAYEDIVEEFGQFDQSTGPDGSHYTTDNPFADQGIRCGNCLFYDADGSCDLVAGDIAEDAVCKLWVIPSDDITAERRARLAALRARRKAAKPQYKGTAPAKSTWPLAARDRAWDGAAAQDRIRAKVGATDGPNAQYDRTHFYVADPGSSNYGDRHLLFCDVVDGEIQAVPRGIFACAAIMQGARGGRPNDMPDGDVAKVEASIGGYYTRMAKEFDDTGIVAPWAAGG